MTSKPDQHLRAWMVVALVWVVAALNYLDRNMITTMRGSLIAAIPMTDAQFGALTSVFLFVYAVLSPFAGYLADRFSRSRVIIVSLLVWSALTWLTGQAKNFEQLIIVRALMGVSEAAYIPAALALIADYHRGATRSLATGIHMTGISVGSGLGGLGGLLAERHGWNYAFVLFGGIGIAYSVLLLLFLRDAPRDGVAAPAAAGPKQSVSFFEALASLFSQPTFYLMLGFWGLLGMAGWAVVGWVPTYLKEHFQLTQGMAGMSATGYQQAAQLMGYLVGGFWADRWSRTNPRARIFVPAIGLCLAAPAVFAMANTGVLAVAIGGLMLYGLGIAFISSNMMPILCMVADPRCRATGYGILNLCSCVIGGVTIYAGGWLRDINVNVSHLFMGSAAGMVVCAVLMLLVKPSAEAGSEAAGPIPAGPLPYTDAKPAGAADFYFAINATFRFMLNRFGIGGLRQYWTDLGTGYFAPVGERWRAGGLPAVAEYWRAFFAAEPGARVEILESPDAVILDVKVCPAIRHLREHGREIVPCFCQHCYFIGEAMGAQAGLTVRVEGGNGSCRQVFLKRDSASAPQDMMRIQTCSADPSNPQSAIHNPQFSGGASC